MNRAQFELAAVLLSSLLLKVLGSSQRCHMPATYTAVNGSLCINEQFTEIPMAGIISKLECSLKCNARPFCQAFSISDGPCKLFLFNRCSRGVRQCGNCSSRGTLFIKQQKGLEPGQLCPAEYTDGLCGLRFAVHEHSYNWQEARERCQNDSGLVVMADVTDAEEMTFIDTQSKSLWLGGMQTPVQPLSKDGWYWADCNTTVDSSLWGWAQPDNYQTKEIVTGRYFAVQKLNDYPVSPTFVEPVGVICKCVSPFD